MFTQEFWDERYAALDHGSGPGSPTQRLVEQVADLAPGLALDVGCGEGADAVWLAQQGWRVVGVDVSQVALDRARRHAGEAGVADRTTWAAGRRGRRRAAAGRSRPGRGARTCTCPPPRSTGSTPPSPAPVRAGGTLLVVGHHPADAGHRAAQPAARATCCSHPSRSSTCSPRRLGGRRRRGADPRGRTNADGDEPSPCTDTVVLARRDAA